MRRRRGLVLLVLALGLAVTATPPESESQGPLLAAHRGGALLWPENSLLAFRNALALGVDLLETDIHLTADGSVIVLHDPTLERTTSGGGAVRDLKTADLAPVRLKGPGGHLTDERVPTLAELLDVLKPTPAGLLLEIKRGPDRRPYAGIEEKALALVRERGLADRVVIMAFEVDTLRRVRQLAPGVRTSLLVGRGQPRPDRVAPAEAVVRAQELGATDLGMDYRLIDGDVVSAARRAGLRLAAWTVNEEADVRRLAGLGAEVIITDQPELARRVLGR